MIDRQKIIKRAIDVYGKDAQLLMAIEEMSELTKAICKENRARPFGDELLAIDHIAEEVADVQIMLDQLRVIFSLDTAGIEERKLIRLQDRLNKREGKQ